VGVASATCALSRKMDRTRNDATIAVRYQAGW
jgi:hypothetical protein